jgi:long-chain acyl-CoA synthetase
MESSSQAAAVSTAFKMFDRDGDGKVSQAEFKAVMGSLVEKLSDQDVEKMMRDADKDGDGFISFDEFKNLLLPQAPLVFGRFIGEKKAGETRHLRSALIPEGGQLVDNFRGFTNIKDIFDKNAQESPDKPLLGTREKHIQDGTGAVVFGEYKWKTFSQVHKEAYSFARYLMHHNLSPKVTNEEGSFRFVSLYAKNREEWVVTDLGAMAAGITTVTLYDTLGQDSIDYILNQTSIKTVVCSSDKIRNIT